MRVGLLGGSFDPPHKGHVHITKTAIQALKLDFVWWLVTPQNPIKTFSPAPLRERMQQCHKIVASHPQIIITDIERDIGTALTYHVVKTLKRCFNGTDFVWLTGMDNALTLHTWNHWRDLLDVVCLAHFTRDPAHTLVRSCPLRMTSKQRHRFPRRNGRYPLKPNTTYWMLQKKIVAQSSTDLRNQGGHYA